MKTLHAIALCLLALVLVASVSCTGADVRGERPVDSSNVSLRSRLSIGSFSSQPPKKVLPSRKVGPIRLPPKTQSPSTIATPTLPTGKPIRPTPQIPTQQTKPTRVIPKQLPVNVKPVGRTVTGTPGPAMKPGFKRSNSAPNLQVGASSKPTPPSLKRSNSMPLLTTKKKGKAVSIQTLAPLLKKYGLLTTALIELMGSSESGVTAPRCDQSLVKGKNGPSLVTTRVVLRKAADPKDINGFTFSLDTQGRVIYASGPVSPKTRGDLSDEAYCIADRMWYEDNNNARDRDLMHTGHIVASALGGTDRDPINFFPQHANSNSRGGVWWIVELIAGETAKFLPKGCVHIQPQLEYADDNTWIPKGGLYYFDISDKCLTTLTTIGKLNSRARVFREIMDNPAFSQVETTLGGQPGRGALITWENAYDKRTLASHPELYESKKH